MAIFYYLKLSAYEDQQQDVTEDARDTLGKNLKKLLSNHRSRENLALELAAIELRRFFENRRLVGLRKEKIDKEKNSGISAY